MSASASLFECHPVVVATRVVYPVHDDSEYEQIIVSVLQESVGSQGSPDTIGWWPSVDIHQCW
jgi:hypothetical protein